jgi:hypothetical protein
MAETLPPLTADDIRGPLNDPTFTVYLYIGKEEDEGWDNALFAFGLLPRLRIYLVRDVSLIGEFVGQKRPKGIVFGWNQTPKRLLNKKEAEDFKIVLKAIQEARK